MSEAAPKKPEEKKNIKIVKDATCTFCGCVCDDMELTVDLDEHRITKAKKACVLGRAWFSAVCRFVARPLMTTGSKN